MDLERRTNLHGLLSWLLRPEAGISPPKQIITHSDVHMACPSLLSSTGITRPDPSHVPRPGPSVTENHDKQGHGDFNVGIR